MGSSSSKFRKHLQNGEEVAALDLYNNNSELRKSLDPNCSYGDSYHHETPLHFAARHGMRTLLRIFLHKNNGNPNKTNAHKETSLHCVCMEKNSQYYTVRRRRADCLNLIIQWRGAASKDGEVEKADLAAQDEKLNTALHYAAASGLKICVELLVQQGSPLFVENIDQMTPCDIAEKNGHGNIALFLESKMVFSNEGTQDGGDGEEIIPVTDAEEYSGLRAQDLQEVKDQLLVETADMLCVPLFTAEALLRNHEWSREALLESWMTDPFSCCEKCGVTPPPSLYSEKPLVQETLNSPTASEALDEEADCDICTCTFMLAEEPVHMPCQHQFCRPCWEQYLNLKIQEGDAHHITCPAYECSRLVPVDVIENVVSRDMARRYLQFDIKAFVDSNPSMKWCPYPGCGRAVHLPEMENNGSSSVISLSSPSSAAKIPPDTSRAVDCGNGHYFCWNCLGEAHEPCSCDHWERWHHKIAEVKPEQLSGTEAETEAAANCLWLVTNSKPCPNCKSPIQKNEGCNHMKCSKCKHDFCWVCLEAWKRHNSSTGGYFKCNRYEIVKKVEQQNAQLVSEAEVKNTEMQELNRFVHYYTRFKNHENSYKLEEPLLSTAKDKMMKLAEAVTDSASANSETKFVEDAVHQLLKARRVLKCSYVYGFYLDGPGYKKIVFECMQTELEECTEILSQMVNRLYLRTPRKKIIEQAHIVQRKRHEFIGAISKGLVPPETPPSIRKRRRRKFSMDLEDEELRKAILASIQDVDPANPWIKDASGRHTNVMAVLEWPDSDSDSSETDTAQTTIRSQGKCTRAGCVRLKARNPRTGSLHDHCSLHCLRMDQLDKMDQQEGLPEIILDEQMELLRALEMSRLQYLRETGWIHIPPTNRMSAYYTSLAAANAKHSTESDVPDDNKSRVIEGEKKTVMPLEELKLEFQRVLGLSSALKGCDADLDEALEESLKDQHKEPIYQIRPTDCIDSNITHQETPAKCTNHNSTLMDHAEERLEELGAYAGAQPVVVQASKGSCFGVIKDLSVANILASDKDKTNSFLDKDFSFGSKQRNLRSPIRQVLAANTPCDESSHILTSPGSDPSGSEVWVQRPTVGSVSSDQTPHTDTDDIGLSEDASLDDTSRGHSECSALDCASLLELTESILQMTAEMQVPSPQEQECAAFMKGPSESSSPENPDNNISTNQPTDTASMEDVSSQSFFV